MQIQAPVFRGFFIARYLNGWPGHSPNGVLGGVGGVGILGDG